MYLLDTNVISEFRKKNNRSVNVVQWSQQIDPSKTFISVITLTEINQGIILSLQHKGDYQQADTIQYWLNSYVLSNYQERILPITQDIALTYSRLIVPDKKPIHDTLIASTAIVHNLTLVTRNVKDFKNIPLDIINPFEFCN